MSSDNTFLLTQSFIDGLVAMAQRETEMETPRGSSRVLNDEFSCELSIDDAYSLGEDAGITISCRHFLDVLGIDWTADHA